jgi:hypothetical protein
MHFHVLGVRSERNFHLSPGNTKESGSLCYGGTCWNVEMCLFLGTSLIFEDCYWISHLDKPVFFWCHALCDMADVYVCWSPRGKWRINSLKLRFREGVFTIHHAFSCAPSIWQDGSGVPNDSNVVIVPLQLRSYGTYYWTRLWMLVSNSNKKIMHTHGHNIQYIQFLQYHTVRCHTRFNYLYWISICEVEGKRTIASAKHWFQGSSQ